VTAVAGQLKPKIMLTAAMSDPDLFGRVFRSPSFWTWRVAAKLIDGLPLTDPREIELYQRCTGRSRPPSRRLRRLIVLAGRRAGKDRFESAVAVWRAALYCDWRKHISAGEQAVVILLGKDKKQAAILRRYCDGLLQAPMLAREVARSTDEVIEFKNGSSLEIITNNAGLVRGRSAIAVLGSECCHWRTDENAASNDEEVVASAVPSMAMAPGGGLLVMASSVFRRRGYMYRQYTKLHGKDESEDSICWFAPSAVMNPRLSVSVVDEALAEDAPRARAEYLNVWRDDTSDFCPLDVIEEATDFGVYERPPQPGVRYVCYVDAAGGTGADSYALAIAHRERDGTYVLDVLRERKPRFVPSTVIATEVSPLLRAYRVVEVEGDNFASGFHADDYAQNRLAYKTCEYTTSENYQRALPLLLAKKYRFIDHASCRTQISSLERTLLPGGGEKITHPKVASAHDDLAAAALGALAMLARSEGSDWMRNIDANLLGRIARLPPRRGYGSARAPLTLFARSADPPLDRQGYPPSFLGHLKV
jgi:hypothetical protein